MSSFLEDLISAGSAVWEQYLSPTLNADVPPPPFPVWKEVPAADAFRKEYAYSVDWREWFVWTNALMCLASARAGEEKCGSGQCLHVVSKYAELNFLHAAENCPGNHAEDWEWIADVLRSMPELMRPRRSSSLSYPAYQFRMAAWHEWQYLRGSYVPEWELSEKDQEYHNGIGTRIEADMFRDTPVTTLLGMAVMAAHFVNLKSPQWGIEKSMAIRALSCVQTGAMSQMADLQAKAVMIEAALALMFKGIDVKLIASHDEFPPERLN